MLNKLFSHSFPRPFAPAHWSIFVILLGTCIYLTPGLQCEIMPWIFIAPVVTGIVFIALWTNHLRVGSIKSPQLLLRLFLGSIIDLVALLLLYILIAIPFIAFTPTAQCYTQRANVVEMITFVSPIKDAISRNIISKNSVANSGMGIEIIPDGKLKDRFVTRDGIIILGKENPLSVVILIPELKDSMVKWNCHGFPSQHMPAACRL